MAFQSELFRVGEEFLNHVLVLLRFEGAGGVDKDAAGFRTGGGVVEQVELEFAEAIDLRGLDAPTHINTASKDARVRAGRVDENAVERCAWTAGIGGCK